MATNKPVGGNTKKGTVKGHSQVQNLELAFGSKGTQKPESSFQDCGMSESPFYNNN